MAQENTDVQMSNIPQENDAEEMAADAAQENNDVQMNDETSEGTQMDQLRQDQVENSAGGFVWAVDDMLRFKRFLVLGSEGGTYYIGEKELGVENLKALQRLIDAGRGAEVVKIVETYSLEGRTAKQGPIIIALAYCARNKNKEVKKAAYSILNKVCRIPTHLFMFVRYCEELSKPDGTGWGRAHRKAISNWYLEKTGDKLAMLVTKYKQREGWSHRDLLRLAHPKAENPNVACVLKYIIKGLDEVMKEYIQEGVAVDQNTNNTLHFLSATEDIKSLEDASEVVKLIKKHGLVREHMPTPMLKHVAVWDALLENMPMTAMIRNLGKMTSIELLKPLSKHATLVCNVLKDEGKLKKARIHPFNVLVALKQYQAGQGDKGSLKWSPVASIVQALDGAFYKTFKFVEPTGKRFLLALDVSGSMSWGGCNGCQTITPRVASAAMAMVTARTEDSHHFVGFSHNLVELDISADMRLDAVIETVEQVPMGGTDCAQPMIYATANNLEVDVFIVYTDCETWAGKVHPSEALKKYRDASGIKDAKLIVCAMTSNGFTLADPEDRGMFDMAGFDSAAPEVIRQFVTGEI